MQVERLTRHSNADDDSVYCSVEELCRVREHGDPLLHLRTALMAQGVCEHDLALVDDAVAMDVRRAAESCLDGAPPSAESACTPPALAAQAPEYRGSGRSQP